MPPPRKNRSHVPAEAGQSRPPPRHPRRRMASRDAAGQSARREAAAVLRRVLRGDASGRAAASIKSLVYSPSVRNKRATFALVCQTLKFLPIVKEVLTSSGVLTSKWKKQEELAYVTAYDILFGQVIDACAAPGNKTVHLAALMNGEGSITACELNKDRAKTLQNTIRRSGANNIQTVNGDFLDMDGKDPSYAEMIRMMQAQVRG